MTWGLMIIVLNLGYFGLSIFIGIGLSQLLLKKTTLKTWKRRVLCTLLSLSVLVAPFWDLLIQKGIKTYYETYKMDDTIYAYPERDRDGKIESLGVGKLVDKTTAGYLISGNDIERLIKEYPVNNFLEIYAFGTFDIKDINGTAKVTRDYKHDLGYVRVHFNQDPISYEKIKDEIEFQARYQVLARMKKHSFFEETVIEFWDKKENQLLAEGWELKFPSEKKKFRSEYLLWQSANGVEFEIPPIDNYNHLMFKKLFGFQLKSYLKLKG
jgi:hypothetical protein